MPDPIPDCARRPLPYVDRLTTRAPEQVDLVVIHCTELPDLSTARAYGERIHYPDTGTGNAGHYYIDRDGSIENWIDITRVAHHVRGFNQRSIGIELVNLGRFPHWHHSASQVMREPYPDAQIEALLGLLQGLTAALPSLARIAGHEDLDPERIPASDDPSRRVARKTDPGPLFPWPRILAACDLERQSAPEE